MPSGTRSRRRRAPECARQHETIRPSAPLRIRTQELDERGIVHAVQRRQPVIARRRDRKAGALQRMQDVIHTRWHLEARHKLAAVQLHAAIVARVQRGVDHLHRIGAVWKVGAAFLHRRMAKGQGNETD